MVITIGKLAGPLLSLLDSYHSLKSLSLGMNNLLGLLIVLVLRLLNLMLVVRVLPHVVVVLKSVILIGIQLLHHRPHPP